MLELFAVILFTCKTMYNKTIIRFGFCDIWNNQGLGKCYQPQPPASADNSYSTLIIPDFAKPHPIIVYNTPWKVYPYSIYVLISLYQKSHSFTALTCSISDT